MCFKAVLGSSIMITHVHMYLKTFLSVDTKSFFAGQLVPPEVLAEEEEEEKPGPSPGPSPAPSDDGPGPSPSPSEESPRLRWGIAVRSERDAHRASMEVMRLDFQSTLYV